jgi:hypothetical protein
MTSVDVELVDEAGAAMDYGGSSHQEVNDNE